MTMQLIYCRLAYVVLWINMLLTCIKVNGSKVAECKITMLGQEYAGRINTTRSGRTCQRWEADSPHSHDNKALSSEENYCRNPDREPEGPWCYTTDQGLRWENCGVPFCETSTENNWSRTVKTSTISKDPAAGSISTVTTTIETHQTDTSRTTMSRTGSPVGQSPNETTAIGTQHTGISRTTTASTVAVPTPTNQGTISIASITDTATDFTCFCPCYHDPNITISHQELQKIIADLKKELYIDKKLTSQAVRRRNSARDKRPSSQVMGSVAVIVLVIVAVFISISDFINLFNFCLKYFGKK